MKQIVDECYDNNYSQMDNIKLRLRGRGSGYKEGPERKESFESLHLCISGKLYSKYRLACELVESHLQQIYMDFQEMLSKYGEDSKLIQIVKKEAVSHKK